MQTGPVDLCHDDDDDWTRRLSIDSLGHLARAGPAAVIALLPESPFRNKCSVPTGDRRRYCITRHLGLVTWRQLGRAHHETTAVPIAKFQFPASPRFRCKQKSCFGPFFCWIRRHSGSAQFGQGWSCRESLAESLSESDSIHTPRRRRYPRESEGLWNHRRWFVCLFVCLFVCYHDN